MSKTKKIILWVVGVIILILAFLYFLGTYGYRIQNYFMAQRQEKVMLEIERQKAEILEAQKNDNYGGKTPEETLDLYITALKAGDIELASKYWEISPENPQLQVTKLEDLKKDIQEGLLDISIGNLITIKEFGQKKIFSEIYVSFVYKYVTNKESTTTMNVSNQEILVVKPAGIEEQIGKALRLNPYTKVWKIIQ
jgi:hypothetical protein